MGIILDLIVLAIISLSVFASARYGFVRTVVELAGYVFAAVVVIAVPFPEDTEIYFRAIIFLVLIIATGFIAKIVNKLFSFSLLGKLNKILGGILGIPKGILLASAFCLLVIVVINVTEDGFLIFTGESIESSMIFEKVLSLPLFK